MKNLILQRFGLLVVESGPIRKNNKIYWHCRCDCGQEKDVRSDLLKNGNTKSCGCYKKQILVINNKERQTLDLTDKIFGKLKAIKKTSQRKDGRVVWECLCECGNISYVDTHSLQQGKKSSCGCLKSKGELLISQLLKKHHIPFEEQKSFSTCKYPNGYLARFDFYVDNKYLIEYDGEQHFYYKDNPHTWNTLENYQKVKECDNYKNQWCKENNIPLIRIPYTKVNELTIEDLLLNNEERVAL